MTIFITGSTGYVGKALTQTLLDRGHQVIVLVREGSSKKLGALADKVTIRHGDITDPDTIDLTGADAIIHLVAIIKEIKSQDITFEKVNYKAALNVMDAAKKQNIRRFLFMSAAGHPPLLLKAYYTTKIKGEDYLKTTDLSWTIFRPSLIFGTRFLGKSMGWIKYFRWIFRLGGHLPLIGPLCQKWTPISLDEISRAFTHAVEDQGLTGQTLMGKSLHQLAAKPLSPKRP
ncbi:MAG: NAD(P)H-binding protein [Spirochaetota bacterium]|nr:NAD(P)H-binding protein [Spirochaetota bacterium]